MDQQNTSQLNGTLQQLLGIGAQVYTAHEQGRNKPKTVIVQAPAPAAPPPAPAAPGFLDKIKDNAGLLSIVAGVGILAFVIIKKAKG